MLDMKSVPCIVSVWPSQDTTTLSMRLPSRSILMTSLFIRTSPFRCSICPFTAVHIIPGPSRGYSNSSMSVLMVCLRFKEHADQRGLQRKIFNALGGPLRFQLRTGDSPDFFGVGLKESVETASCRNDLSPTLRRCPLADTETCAT